MSALHSRSTANVAYSARPGSPPAKPLCRVGSKPKRAFNPRSWEQLTEWDRNAFGACGPCVKPGDLVTWDYTYPETMERCTGSGVICEPSPGADWIEEASDHTVMACVLILEEADPLLQGLVMWFELCHLQKERPSLDIVIDGEPCVAVAALTPAERNAGLQPYPALPHGVQAMIFPFDPPRDVTFHMGCVAFPIDIAFCDADGRVLQVARDCRPGSLQTWTSHAAFVVEADAGTLPLEEDKYVHIPEDEGVEAQSKSYDLLRTLSEEG